MNLSELTAYHRAKLETIARGLVRELARVPRKAIAIEHLHRREAFHRAALDLLAELAELDRELLREAREVLATRSVVRRGE